VPATTVSYLYTTHSQYLDAANLSHTGFRKALNEVMPRLYKMGYWRDLYVEHTQEASKGYIALPQDTDSIVSGIIDNNVVPTRSLWHDYKLFGTNDDDSTLISSFIDDGYHTTYRDLGGTVSDYYQLKITDIGPNTSNYIFQHADAKIFVTCKVIGDPNNPITIELNNVSEQLSQKLSPNQDIYSIERIYYEGIPSGHLTRLTAVYKTQTDATKDVILADIPSGQGEIRYRRYRIGGTDSGSSAHILTKRRWVPLNININTDSSEDPIYVPEDAIVKHALLGKLSEDNGDIQRAEYHWGVCGRLLEKDSDSFRGAAKPSLHIAPNGIGSGMRGMY
tara:strand:- start:69 stop:1073 length:1005 start_codon:yes stop_codon:yes gene_type:complete